MKHFRLEKMLKGWFVGAFSPTVFDTEVCEVGVKKYKAGDKDDSHYHKLATEITVILSGTVIMLEREWTEGDIILLPPGEPTSFEAITDATCLVVKLPGAKNDKFMV